MHKGQYYAMGILPVVVFLGHQMLLSALPVRFIAYKG